MTACTVCKNDYADGELKTCVDVASKFVATKQGKMSKIAKCCRNGKILLKTQQRENIYDTKVVKLKVNGRGRGDANPPPCKKIKTKASISI